MNSMFPPSVQKLFEILLKKNSMEVFMISMIEMVFVALKNKYNILLEDLIHELTKDLLDEWTQNRISSLDLELSEDKSFDGLIQYASNKLGSEFLQELDSLVNSVVKEIEGILGEPKLIGGCAGTIYGCCPDGINPKTDPSGNNCMPLIGGCAGTIYGCCPNSKEPKTDPSGNNCKCGPLEISPIQYPFSDTIPSYKIGTDGFPKSLFHEFNKNSYELLYSLYVSYQNTCTPQYLIGQYGNCYKGGTPCPTVPDVDIIGPSQIFIIRHAEKTSGDWFISQNGIYRASQLVNWVNDLCCRGFPISYIVTYNPCELTSEDASMRGQQTVAFTSTMLNIPTYTFSGSNLKNDGSPGGPEETVNRIFDASNNIFQGKNILICWEHGNIQKLIESIVIKKLTVDPSFYSQYQTAGGTIESASNNYWKIQDPCTNGSYINNSLSPTQPPNEEYQIQALSAIYKPYWNTDDFDLFYLFNNEFNFSISQQPILTAYENCNLNICMLQEGTGCISSNKYGTEESCEVPDESDIISVSK